MRLDRPFAAEAARGLVVMLLIPIVIVVPLTSLLGEPPSWQDILQALLWLLFLDVVVMARRSRPRRGSP